MTRELLELAFQCHPSELVGPGTKRLLRRALAGDVPGVNLQRPDKGRSAPPRDMGPRRFAGEVPDLLAPVLAPGWPPDAEISYWDVFRTCQLVAFTRAFQSARAGSSAARLRETA